MQSLEQPQISKLNRLDRQLICVVNNYYVYLSLYADPYGGYYILKELTKYNYEKETDSVVSQDEVIDFRNRKQAVAFYKSELDDYNICTKTIVG